jgi:hypothetical protein
MYTILRTVDAGTETATATATCKLQAPSCQDPTIDSSGLVASWPRGLVASWPRGLVVSALVDHYTKVVHPIVRDIDLAACSCFQPLPSLYLRQGDFSLKKSADSKAPSLPMFV